MSRTSAAMLVASLALAACGADYTREGATDDQYKRDTTSCRSFVGEMMSKERGINMDREATIGESDARYGRVRLPQQMAQRTDNLRSDKLMDACMTQRGWTSKRNDWLPF